MSRGVMIFDCRDFTLSPRWLHFILQIYYLTSLYTMLIVTGGSHVDGSKYSTGVTVVIASLMWMCHQCLALFDDQSLVARRCRCHPHGGATGCRTRPSPLVTSTSRPLMHSIQRLLPLSTDIHPPCVVAHGNAVVCDHGIATGGIAVGNRHIDTSRLLLLSRRRCRLRRLKVTRLLAIIPRCVTMVTATRIMVAGWIGMPLAGSVLVRWTTFRWFDSVVDGTTTVPTVVATRTDGTAAVPTTQGFRAAGDIGEIPIGVVVGGAWGIGRETFAGAESQCDLSRPRSGARRSHRDAGIIH